MLYRIAVCDVNGIVETYTRRKCAAAEFLLETVIYRLIRNTAGLDTKRGRKVHEAGQRAIHNRGGYVDVSGRYGVFYTVSKG